MRIKKGFTLAETLITVAIVGIIAAIGLPAIRSAKPNQEMLMLKKVYYLTGRMVNELINDDDFYPDTDDENSSGFSNTNPEPAAMYHGQKYEGVTKFCGLFAARMNVKGDINCPETGYPTKDSAFTAGGKPSGGSFTTADGVVWVLPISDFSTIQSIYVDVNGDKPGNCFAGEPNCIIPDRFEIKVDRWGKIYVDDDATKKYLSVTDMTKSYAEATK